MRAITALLVISVLAPVALQARQQPRAAKHAALSGVVADTSKRPIVGAEVVAVHAKRTVTTNSKGVFILGELNPGKEVFLVRQIGYRAQAFDANLLSGDTLKVGVILGNDPLRLPDVTTEPNGTWRASALPRSANMTQADLERLRPTSIRNALLYGGLHATYNSQGQEVLRCPRGGGVASIYLDGFQLTGSLTSLSPDPMSSRSIEVYRSNAQLPVTGNPTSSFGCSAMIWTK